MNPTVAQGASAHAPCHAGRQAHGGQASSAWLCVSGYRRHCGWHRGLASHGPRPGSSKMPGLSRRPGSRAWGRGVTADSLEGAERGTWWLCPEMGQRHADSGGCAGASPRDPESRQSGWPRRLGPEGSPAATTATLPALQAALATRCPVRPAVLLRPRVWARWPCSQAHRPAWEAEGLRLPPAALWPQLARLLKRITLASWQAVTLWPFPSVALSQA